MGNPEQRPSWEKIKERGSDHYKKSPHETEPIDLYLSGGILKHFAIASIIKYAYRNRQGKLRLSDLDKISHYVDMLRFVAYSEEDEENGTI